MLRHNLDVMYIEENIVDSIFGNLFDILGKTKDHAKARYDLKDMGIRKNLYPQDIEDSKRIKFTKAFFSMTNGEKFIFCGVLMTTKLPDGIASNISRCVHLDERKVSNYKTMKLISCYIACFQYKFRAFFLIMWLLILFV